MKIYELPQQWDELSDNVLAAELEKIERYAQGLQDESAEFNFLTEADEEAGLPSGLEVLESLAAAKGEIEAAQTLRAEKAEAEQDRRAKALAAFADDEDEDEVTEAGGDEDEDVAELAEDEDDEDIADPEPEPFMGKKKKMRRGKKYEDDEKSDDADESASSEDDDDVELADGGDEDDDAKPAEKPEVLDDAEMAARLGKMNGKRTSVELPALLDRPNGGGKMFTTGKDFHTVQGFGADDPLSDIDALAGYMTERINNRPRSDYKNPEPDYRSFVTMSADWDDSQLLKEQDTAHNYAVTTRAMESHVDEQSALVAAGGSCAPIPPSYDFPSCFAVQRPVEQMLPVVGAPRGGIRFQQVQPLNAMAAGVGFATEAQGRLLPGDVGYTAKNCTRVTCPTDTEVLVDRFHWCVTFDNLGYRTFPEHVRHMLELLNLEYTRRKEVYYLNQIDAIAGAAVDITAAQPSPMGAARSLIRDLVTAGHNYRKRNNMDRNALLNVCLPDVVEDILLVDAAQEYFGGGIEQLARGNNAGLVNVLTQRARLNVSFYYYDGTNGGFPASAHTGVGTAWNPLPSRIRFYMHAPGALIRLDGGSLDMGLVRDSVLNSQNDLQLFAEEWLAVANPGCEVRAYDTDPCSNGVGPLGVAAPACP